MEPKSLNSFLNEMKTKGLRKKNQFQIIITTGDNEIDKALENFTMWTNNAFVPHRQQQFIDVPYHGYPFKMPSIMVMEQETSLTVKCDGQGEMRRAFLAWQNKISNAAITDGSIGEGNKKIPDGSVRILCFGDDEKTVIESYKLVGAAVSNVGPMEFSNDDAGAVTFELGLTFQYWELENTIGKFNDIR